MSGGGSETRSAKTSSSGGSTPSWGPSLRFTAPGASTHRPCSSLSWGFIRADDPRMRSTVAAIQERLTTDGLVHRYLADDGLSGEEGAFAICSFWLADNLALQGQAR
ncbi:MAG: glycoside hydrolase family 15 protein [Actinomycetota bacterium]